MSVTSMEQFTELPEGTRIVTQTNGITWTREDVGWRNDQGFTVAAAHFAGEVTAGRVTIGPAAHERAFLWDGLAGSYAYSLIIPDTRTTGWWWALQMLASLDDDGQYVANALRVERIDPSLYPPSDTPWAGINEMWPLALTLAQEYVTNERLQGMVDRHSDLRQQVQAALHEYHSDQGGLTSGERDALNEMMENLDMEPWRGLEEVEVTVTVDGTTTIEMDSDDARARVPNVDCIDDVSGEIEVSWTWEFTREFEVDSGICACDNVDEYMVDNALNDADIAYSGRSWQASCPNC